MEEAELIGKLESIDLGDVVIPGHKARLASLIQAAQKARAAQPGNKSWGFGNLFSRFSLKWAAPSLAVIAVAVTLALILPPMLGKDNQVLATASDIALASPAVQTALNGSVPVKIVVTDNFGSSGISRVVMAVPPTQAVIADVDMGSKKVIQVTTQNASDITEEQVFSIAEN